MMDDEAIRARLYDLPRLLALRAALRRVGGAGEPRAEVTFGNELARGTRLGLLPGSFNPLTVAHTALAEAGLASGAVDRVLFTLSTHTVDKDVVTGAALEDRLLALELACDGDPRLGVLLVNRGLYVEQAELARATWDIDAVVFLVGFDKIVQVLDPRYYADREEALARLFGLASFLVAPRGADDASALAALLARAENRPFAHAIRPLDLPADVRQVASSRVRAAVPRGTLPAEELPPVARVFVQETGAYDGRHPEAAGLDRYRLRLALLDALEVTDGPTGGADFRALYARALAERL